MGVVLVFGFGRIRLTVLLSRVMRFSCLMFGFVMGGGVVWRLFRLWVVEP